MSGAAGSQPWMRGVVSRAAAVECHRKRADRRRRRRGALGLDPGRFAAQVADSSSVSREAPCSSRRRKRTVLVAGPWWQRPAGSAGRGQADHRPSAKKTKNPSPPSSANDRAASRRRGRQGLRRWSRDRSRTWQPGTGISGRPMRLCPRFREMQKRHGVGRISAHRKRIREINRARIRRHKSGASPRVGRSRAKNAATAEILPQCPGGGSGHR